MSFCGFCPIFSFSALSAIVFISFSFPDGVPSCYNTEIVILKRMLERFDTGDTKIIYVL